MAKNASLLRIFLTTLKLGAFTFGGGYAMIPLFKNEFVDKFCWIKQEDILNMVALSQSVPGAIAINCCILIGYRLKKLRGALVAVFGVILMPLILLTIITCFYESVKDNVYVAGALKGVRAAVVALLFYAFFSLIKPFRKDVLALIAFSAALVVSLAFGASSIIIILAAIVFGVTAGILRIKKEKCAP